MTFRPCEGTTSASLTISTTSTEMTITEVSTSSTVSTLTFHVLPTRLSGLCGDYTVDLASKSTADDITHWGHGTVTILDEPIAW